MSQHHVSMKLVYGHNFIMVGFSGPMVRGASPLEVSQTWPVPEPELFSSNLLGKLASAWENNLKLFREPVASSGQYYLANKKKYYLETAANDLYEMFSCSLVIIWPVEPDECPARLLPKRSLVILKNFSLKPTGFWQCCLTHYWLQLKKDMIMANAKDLCQLFTI